MRRNKAPKREIQPDVRFGNVKVQSFINRVMKDGKKSVASRMVYQALDIVQERTGNDGLEMFEKAIENASPIMEVKPQRIGGATYQVPMEVSSHRQFALATRWILGAARGRSGKSFPELLADELLDAANSTGSAVRKREEAHRMAKANRAFSHFRA